MIYHFCNRDEPITLDPAHIFGLVEQRVTMFLFEGLTGYDAQMKTPVPGMAEKWHVSDDSLKYTFFLRQNACWSDGQPVTAHDFVYAWRRILDYEADLPYTYLLFHIAGCEVYYRDRQTSASSLGFKALTDYELEVNLVRPLPYFLWLTSFITLSPLPAHLAGKHDADWWKTSELISNGPFCLINWQKGEVIRLARNDKYWDAANVRLSEVHINLTTDEGEALAGYQDDRTHHIYDVPSTAVDAWRGTPDLDLSPRFAITYLLINPTRVPLINKYLRRALSLALKREQLTEIQQRGDLPAYSYVPPYLPGYTGFTGIQPSLEAARELLKMAGFPGGSGCPELEIIYTYPDQERILTQVKNVWENDLGLCIKLVKTSWEDYLNGLNTLQYGLTTSKWIADYPDPSTFLSWFISDCASAELGYSNELVDQYLRQALACVDPEQRAINFRGAEQIIVEDDAILIPLFFHANRQLRKQTLRGVCANPFDLHPPKYIWIGVD
jgi:oligopeptide transport system substrate-binding protein